MEADLIMITNRLGHKVSHGNVADRLILPYEQRQKARQRVQLASGRHAGLFLPRGTVLHDGDVLISDRGLRIGVEAALEKVSITTAGDALLLARIAYHLGNRHAPVQILPDHLIYRHDHVLDEMVRGLGGTLTTALHPFEPEEGAYHGVSHAHVH